MTTHQDNPMTEERAKVEAVAWRDDLVSVLESANDASAVPLTWLASTDITPDQVKAWMSETVDNTVAADAFSGELHSIAEDESGKLVAFTGCGPKSAANAKFMIWCAHFVLKHGDSLLDHATAITALEGEVAYYKENFQSCMAALNAINNAIIEADEEGRGFVPVHQLQAALTKETP